MRVILDTNILVSYLLNPANSGRTVAQIMRAMFEGRFDLVLPMESTQELRRTVNAKPHLRRVIPEDELTSFLSLLTQEADSLTETPAPQPRVADDPKDDYLLAASAFADVDVLVSGDRHLLALRDVLRRPAIMTAAEFLDLIDTIDAG